MLLSLYLHVAAGELDEREDGDSTREAWWAEILRYFSFI